MGCFPSVYEINSYFHLMHIYGYFATGADDYQCRLFRRCLRCLNFCHWNLIGMYHLQLEVNVVCFVHVFGVRIFVIESYRYVSPTIGSWSFDEYTAAPSLEFTGVVFFIPLLLQKVELRDCPSVIHGVMGDVYSNSTIKS